MSDELMHDFNAGSLSVNITQVLLYVTGSIRQIVVKGYFIIWNDPLTLLLFGT